MVSKSKIGNRHNKISRLFLGIGALLFLILDLVILDFTGTNSQIINLKSKIINWFPVAYAASAPSIITYQGKLLVNNLNATTTQSMKFVLYDSLTAGTALYTASGTLPTTSTISVTPSNGLFSVNLGDTGTNSIDPTIFQNNQSVFLEVTIGGETLTPRKQITASPYAYNAKYLDGAASSSTAPASQFIPLTDTDGNLNLRNVTSTGLDINSSAGLAINVRGFTSSSPLTVAQIRADVNETESFNGQIQGVSNFIYDASSTSGITLSGSMIASFNGIILNSGATYTNTIVGVSGSNVITNGTSSAVGVIGISGISTASANSYVPLAVGVRGRNGVSGGYVVDSVGLWAAPIVGSNGTIENSYSLKVDPPGYGNTQWTAFIGTGNSAIKGSLVVGASSTPGYTVDVQGTLGVTGTSTLPSGIWASSGNVGIGTTTPAQALVVAGDVSFGNNFSWGNTTSSLTLGQASDLDGSSLGILYGDRLTIFNSIDGDSNRSLIITSNLRPTTTNFGEYAGLRNLLSDSGAQDSLVFPARVSGVSNGVSLSASNTRNEVYGSYNTASVSKGTATSTIGVLGYSLITGQSYDAPNLNNVFGVKGKAANSINANITNLGGLQSEVILTTGTIANAFGLHVQTFTGPMTGTLTNAYGLKIDAPSIGTNQWTAGFGTGNSYFEGSLAVGGKVTSTAALTVSGQAIFGTTTNPGTYQVFIDSGSSTTAALGAEGFIKASGYVTGSTTLDLAEQYPVDPNCSAIGSCPEAGDAVCVSINQEINKSTNQSEPVIEKCSLGYASNAIGIISTNPGFTLGGLDSPNSRKVALAGRVPLKVSTKNGPIKIGDHLTTSDIPGVAVKATADGPSIGIALEDFANNNETMEQLSATGGSASGGNNSQSSIIAFVKVSWWLPSLITTSTDSNSMGEPQGLFASILNWFKGFGVTIEKGIVSASQFVAGLVTADEIRTKKLCIDEVCVTKGQLQQMLNQEPSSPEPPASATYSPPLISDPESFIENSDPIASSTVITTTLTDPVITIASSTGESVISNDAPASSSTTVEAQPAVEPPPVAVDTVDAQSTSTASTP